MSARGEELPPLAGLQLVGAALLLGLANFMVVLDMSIANVSVPHIAGGLAVAPAQGTWVITSYGVAEAITVPLTGWLVQRFGGLKVFVAALAGFGVFSFACGLAPTFGLLVAFRVLQGLCGGPIMPISQTLLLRVFPRERSGSALALWSMTTVAAPVAGPTFGGLISDGIGWSWIFFINIPVAITVALGCATLLRGRDEPGRRAPMDYVGLGLLVVWVGALQIMLDKGKELEWFASTTIVGLALVAAIGFACFLIWELTAENPIVDLRVFRHRGFTIGVAIVGLTFGAYFASAVLVPLWLQTTMGYTATWAGYATSFNGLLAILLSPLVGRFLVRVDTRKLITFGVLGMGVIAFWRTHFTTDVTFSLIAATFLVQGAMLQFFFLPAMRMALMAASPEETASAAGLTTFIRNCGAAFATSIMTTSWDNIATEKRSELVAHLNDVPGAVETLTSHGLTAQQATVQVDHLVQQQAVMLATNHIFMVIACTFVVAASIVWLAPRPNLNAPAPSGGH